MGIGDDKNAGNNTTSVPTASYSSTLDFEGNEQNNRSIIPPHMSNAQPITSYSLAPDPPQKFIHNDQNNSVNSDESYRYNNNERKPLLSDTTDEVLMAVREAGEEAVEKVTLCSRLFCGVLEISCHWWTLFILFILYISLASFGLIGFFQHMKGTWETRQQVCISELPLLPQECILDRLYTVPYHTNQFWWFAHPVGSRIESVKLFPDCRFIVKKGYDGKNEELYGSDLRVGATVPCYLPSDWNKDSNAVQVVDGILTNKVWPSHTGKLGVSVSIGVAVGLLCCFSVCAWISWLVSAECRDNCVVDLHEAGDVEANYTALWGYPNTVYWTCNPFYCVKLCIPITVPLKLIMNVMIVVITVTLLILYGMGCKNSNC